MAINLQLLIGIAPQELARVENETLEAIGHRMAEEEWRATVSSSHVLSAGMILTCPQDEEGLYKITARAHVDNLVLDDWPALTTTQYTHPQTSRVDGCKQKCNHMGGHSVPLSRCPIAVTLGP